jgi:hypothetical protein
MLYHLLLYGLVGIQPATIGRPHYRTLTITS